MDEVLAFLKAAGTYYLATVDAQGDPQVRPFGTITLFEGRLYIQTGRVKPVSDQMLAHPRIALCAFAKGRWLRVEADARPDARIEAQEAVLADYPGLRKRYRAGDGNTEVFALENVRARFCSFTAKERVVEF